jgi:hypothetical protein
MPNTAFTAALHTEIGQRSVNVTRITVQQRRDTIFLARERCVAIPLYQTPGFALGRCQRVHRAFSLFDVKFGLEKDAQATNREKNHSDHTDNGSESEGVADVATDLLDNGRDLTDAACTIRSERKCQGEKRKLCRRADDHCAPRVFESPQDWVA